MTITIIGIFALLTLLGILAVSGPSTRLSRLLLRSFGPQWREDRSPRANYLAAGVWFAKGSVALVPLFAITSLIVLRRNHADPSVPELLVVIATMYLAAMAVGGAIYCGIRAALASREIKPDRFEPPKAA